MTPPSNNASNYIESSASKEFGIGNSTSHGDDSKAYELNKTGGSSVAKQIKSNIEYFIALIAIILILLAIGYRRNKRLSK